MLTCPYCNSALDQVQPSATPGRAACPRCGEPLPQNQAADAFTAVPAMPSPLEPPRAHVPFPPKPVAANRRTALCILGIMGFMAGLGLIYALATQSYRRQHDPKKIEPPPLSSNPGELIGLGYLPADTNVVAALSVTAAVEDKEAGKMLQAPLPPLLHLGLERIEQWTGLKVQDLDQVVVGARLANELPQLTVVLITRKAYDLKAVEKALSPARPVLHRGKPRFQFSLKPAGEGLLWCPADKALVLILRADAVKTQDLDAIPLRPVAEAANLSADLRHLLDKRLNQQSVLFAAGQLERLDLLQELWVLAGGQRQGLAPWTKVRSFTLGVTPVEGLTLEGRFFTGEPKATQAVKSALEKVAVEGARSQKVVAPPPEITDADAQWVLWQVRGDAAMVRRWLSMEAARGKKD